MALINPRRNARGKIESPVVYFIDKTGFIIPAPDSSHPTPEGFERQEVDTLAEIDRITRIIATQDRNFFSRMMARDREMMRGRHEKIRTKLNQRLLAADCSSIERSFIRSAFAYFDKKDKELHDFELNSYFHAREFDSVTTEPRVQQSRSLPVPQLSERLRGILG